MVIALLLFVHIISTMLTLWLTYKVENQQERWESLQQEQNLLRSHDAILQQNVAEIQSRVNMFDAEFEYFIGKVKGERDYGIYTVLYSLIEALNEKG